ncbi:MAG: hypothetical protein Q9225_002877 [Loekoesia sp. 1 TL-2023]
MDHPPANDITWLYPNDYNQNLTFNVLDIVNVSWISAYAPAFLNLACQHKTDNGYSSAIQIQVPATGNRLISLNAAATYRDCHFEISAPANFTNISHSPSFEMTAKDDREPVFWTMDHLNANTQQEKASRHESCTSDPQKKFAMIGIGIGVAVGVFAITTAAYTLLTIARRKGQLQFQQKNIEKKRSLDQDPRTKDWVLNRLSPSSSCHEVDTEGKKDCGVTNEWMETQRRKGDFYEVDAAAAQWQRHEMESRAVGKLESK